MNDSRGCHSNKRFGLARITTFKQIHFDTESVKENVGRELVVVVAKCSDH